MKKVLITILAFTLVTVGAIFVLGQTNETAPGKQFGRHGKHGKFGKRGKRGMRGGHMMTGRLFRQLDLTDEQKSQMKEIHKASRENTKSLRQQMRQNAQQLRQLTENGTFDEAAVTALAQQQGQIHAQLIVEKQRVQSQIFNVLTPEQKTKVSQLKAEFRQKMQERKAKWAEKMKEKKAQQ